MKLAQALLERADLMKKINILSSRLINNSRVQEGSKVSEEPEDLLKELDEKLKRLEFLIVKINKTNENTLSKSGETVSSMLAKRDVLNLKLNALKNFLESGTNIISRVTHSEIRVLPSFDVRKTQKQVDDLSKEVRELDGEIQELNWTVDIID